MSLDRFAADLREGTSSRNKKYAQSSQELAAQLKQTESVLCGQVRRGRYLVNFNNRLGLRNESHVGRDGDEDDDEDDSWLNEKQTEKEVVVDHELIPIWQYLGQEWTSRINAIQKIGPGKASSSLVLGLRPHQDVGVEKVIFVSSMEPNACVVGDEMGLGKSLLTLEVLRRVDERQLVRGCCDIIICPKLCQDQWMNEINQAYDEKNKPRAIILDDKNITAHDILTGGYNILIVTYQFVLARHKAMVASKQFYFIIEELGLEALKKMPDNMKANTNTRTTNSLYSDLYSDLDLPFRHVVLDEGQLAKKETGKIHEAIRELPKRRLLFLSGTFIPNHWTDLRGVMHLFPRPHPFDMPDRFNKAFGHLNQTGVYVEPSNSKRNRLIKYLMGLVVARPSSVMEMTNLDIEYHDFILNEHDACVSTGWAYKFLRAMKMSGRSVKALDKKESRAMVYAMRAQQYVCGRILVPEKGITAEKKVKMDALRLLETYYRSQLPPDEKDKAVDVEFAKFTETITSDLVEYMDRTTMRKDKQKEEKGDDEDDDDEEDEEEDATYKPTNESVDEDDVMIDVDDDDDDDDDEPEPYAKRDRVQWLATLKAASDQEVFTDKVIAILELISMAHKVYPGQKLIVFSILLTFQDLLHEALCRKGAKFMITRIDGECKSRQEAKDRLAEFETASSDSIALVTAGTASFGLNMQYASLIIQAEPWWNINVEMQSYYRCHRPGQKNNVHVWIIRGINSPIDFIIQNARDRKEETNLKIYGPLRRPDDEAPVIPHQSRGGIGEIHRAAFSIDPRQQKKKQRRG